jgi:hypothetical protein
MIVWEFGTYFTNNWKNVILQANEILRAGFKALELYIGMYVHTTTIYKVSNPTVAFWKCNLQQNEQLI